MKMEDFKLKLEFSIDEINMIFKLLGNIPYDIVSGLIDDIKRQIEPQLLPPESFDEAPEINSQTDHPFG
jgi:hypothetical protein